MNNLRIGGRLKGEDLTIEGSSKRSKDNRPNNRRRGQPSAEEDNRPPKRTTVRRRGQPSAEEDNRPPKRTTVSRRGQTSAEEDNRQPKRTTVRRRERNRPPMKIMGTCLKDNRLKVNCPTGGQPVNSRSSM